MKCSFSFRNQKQYCYFGLLSGFLIGIILGALPAISSAAKFNLIQDGKANGVIFVAPNSTETASYAAEELRDHLELATGVNLPIVNHFPEGEDLNVVLVGPSKATAERGLVTDDLQSEGYFVKSGDNWLALLGDDTDSPWLNMRWWIPRPIKYGTLSAVYRFLEDVCGVRWFMPGELGTVVPSLDTVAVPRLDIEYAPVLRDRAPLLGRNLDARGEVGRWALRVGFGRSINTYFNHTFRHLSNNRELFETKPHIFAIMADGQRDFKRSSYSNGNLCLAEPDTVVEFVRMMREYFDANPYMKEFSVVPNDMWVPCTCDGCLANLSEEKRDWIRREGSVEGVVPDHSGMPAEVRRKLIEASGKIYWDFVTAVATQLYQSHPDRLVGVLGGYDVEDMPADRLPPNIAFCITKTRGRFATDQDYQEQIYEWIRKAGEITENIFVWEYYHWNIRHWGGRPRLAGYPIFFPGLLDEDIKFTTQYIRGEKLQYAEWNSGDFSEYQATLHPLFYLTGKLLYRPELDVDELLADYYSKFYGAAQEEMKAFWELAENCWMRPVEKPVEKIYTDNDLRNFFSLLDQAQAKVEPGSKEYLRIDMVKKEMSEHKWRLATALPDPWDDWLFRKDPENRGIAEEWFKAEEFSEENWQPVEVPAVLAKTNVGPYLGYGWYTSSFKIPLEYQADNMQLLFEGVDEQAWVFVNGHKIFEHSTESTGLGVGELWSRPFRVDLPVEILNENGKNRLFVRKHSSAGQSGIYRPVHLIAPNMKDNRNK